jgi:hypothetical protein
MKEGAAKLCGVSLALQIVQYYADLNGSRCNVAAYTQTARPLYGRSPRPKGEKEPTCWRRSPTKSEISGSMLEA